MQNAPGKGMLKVTGILYIVFGAISVIGMLLLFGGIGALLGMAAIGALLGAVMALSAVLNVVFGIFAVKYCGDIAKANLLFIFGIILVVMQVASVVTSLDDINYFSTIIGFVLPVLYLVGAHRNKQAA